jgi:endonuclease/exonuclease/phosphatase family metal-dependent hydrolase
MNLSNFPVILPGILTVIIIILVEILIFMFKSILKDYKISLLTFIIVITRLGAQFIVNPFFLFVFNFVLFFTTIIWNIEILLLIENFETEIGISAYISGILLGLGIQYGILILNVSSNISWATIKILPTILFCLYLEMVNYFLFTPSKIKAISGKIAKNVKEEIIPKISYFHFLIIGTLFLLSAIWMLNPMALSAYDILNLNLNNIFNQSTISWSSYGYTYYIFIILGTLIVSYIFIHRKLSLISPRKFKYLLLIFVGSSLIINLLSIFIIEENYTVLSTIYLTFLTISNALSLIFYFTYIFHFYSFHSRLKLFLGLLIFFFTVFFFIILQIEIFWYSYLSLLVNVAVLSIVSSLLIYILEIKNIRVSLKLKKISFSNKNIITAFLLIIILNGLALIYLSQARTIRSSEEDNPRVMIWNIHNAIGVDDVFDLERITSDIKQNDPDIIGLNEVDLGALKTSFVDIPSYISHKLGMYYFYGFTFYKHYGNLLLSKYPIKQAEIIELPLIVGDAEPRALIKATIEINSQDWTFYITHLSTKREDRLAQVPFIVNKINEKEEFKRIIWLGDFNLEPTSEAYTYINGTTSLNFTDTYDFLNVDPGFTGHFDESASPKKRIDYIMCSPDLIPKSSEIFCSLASDHCAVITDF